MAEREIGSLASAGGPVIKSGGSVTQSGAIRNNPVAWKALAKIWEDLYGKGKTPLSPGNIWKIENELVPRVDARWIEWFPEHAAFKDQVISQHHIGTLPFTTPLTWYEHYVIHGMGRYKADKGWLR